MEIKWLKTFIVAAKYENFRQASEELFLTQPAITKHIKRLEEYVHIPLFERTGKSVALTPAGFKFLPYAIEVVAKYEESLENFEAWKQGYHRKLIIASAPQIASSILPSLLSRFISEHPDIEVIINIVQSYDIGEEISAGRADLGLSRIQPIQTNLNTQIVHKEKVIFVGPYENNESINEKTALQSFRLITHDHPEYWDELLADIKRYYPTIRSMTVNQVEITKRFIEEGLGVSFLPFSMVKEELKMNKLVQITTDNITLPESATYVVTKVETNEVVSFIKFLKERLG